jgi:hypothetical protein
MRGKIEKKKTQSKEKRNEGGKHNGPNGVRRGKKKEERKLRHAYVDACRNKGEPDGE